MAPTRLTVAPLPRRQHACCWPPPATRTALVFACALLWLAAVLLPATSSAFFTADFEQRYFFEELRIITDHSLIWVPGDGYHIYYTIGVSGEGWPDPGNMVEFGHATSQDLTDWTIHPRVLSIQEGTWKSRNLFAPQVMEDPPHGWMMYYTGLDSITVLPDTDPHIMQAIGVASSTNLYDWVDLSVEEPAYRPDTTWAVWSPEFAYSHCRDPFAWRVDGGVLLITTSLAKAAYTGTDDKGAISIAESTDGIQFDDLGVPLFLNDTWRVFESTSIYRRPDRYFLFFHEYNVLGIHYMSSNNLMTGWDKSNAQTLDPYAFGPGEVVYADGSTLFSRVIDVDYNGAEVYGVKIDTLNWTSESTQYVSTNTLWDDWSIVDGHAFDHQPTFGDRPWVRADSLGPRSRFEGHFWINSAETYDGPLDIRDPDVPPVFEATGILRSHTFQVTGGHFNLRVGGGNDRDSLYVALVDASVDTILARSTGTGDPSSTNSNELFLRHWSLAGMLGMDVYIEIVDLRQDTPYGYIAVDAIEEGQGPGIGVGDQGSPPLAGLRLGAPYPNPVLRGATLPLALERPGRVRLALYDVQGRMRRLIRDADLPAGAHQLAWDGLDADGRSPAAGIYFVRLDADGQVVSRKIVIDR